MADSGQELLLGPTVESIGVVGAQIVVFCGWRKRSVNEFRNTVGYNIIDTKTGVVAKGLDEKGMEGLLRRKNLGVPSMESPAKYFR
ncbi:MAG TPA: hypothetical protein VI653_04240 [Steroidobacteraceae bacterium]